MTDQKAILRDRARRERSQKFISSNFNVILKAPEIESARQLLLISLTNTSQALSKLMKLS